MPKNQTIVSKKGIVNKPIGRKSNLKLWLLVLPLVLLLIGLAASFFLLSTNQDLRQQAAGPTYSRRCKNDRQCESGFMCLDGNCIKRFGCSASDPTACDGHPEFCHCLGGPACTGTICSNSIEASCINQGRSYCRSKNGNGMSCCSTGYRCCDKSLGCCPN